MRSFPEIYCDVCKKPVTSRNVMYVPMNQVFDVVVGCHGAISRCSFPAQLFRDGWRIKEAMAFSEEGKKVEVVEAEIVQPVVKSLFSEDELEASWQERKQQLSKGDIEYTPPLCLGFKATHKLDFNGPEFWASALKEAL